MNTITPKPKLRYWLISIIAFIWNSIGILAYLGQAYISDDDLKLLPEANQLYYSNMPAWVTSAFAVARAGSQAEMCSRLGCCCCSWLTFLSSHLSAHF